MLITLLLAATFDGAFFGTYVAESGPENPKKQLVSTNWFRVGADRNVGKDVSIHGRAKFSLEPLTIPEKGYPQLFQYVSPRSGGPLVDAMRAHDLIEEVAAGAEWKALQIYLAPVGTPPLGAEPYAQRSSSIDFAEAPFAYDVQESFHVGTRVIAGAVTSRFADVEYGVFHASQTTGRHTSIDDGDIDSWSARITFAPQSKLSAQVSTGRLTDAKRKVDSASATYNIERFAASAIWTRQEDETAYGLEMQFVVARSTFLARSEYVRDGTHTALGYIFDVLRKPSGRTGIGFNFDYNSNTKSLEDVYGHKPQTIFVFVRWRTDSTRPASP